jgi:hypothetical protein
MAPAVRKKLLRLLEGSDYFVPEKVRRPWWDAVSRLISLAQVLVLLNRVPFGAEMLEERAILLSRISQHSQVGIRGRRCVSCSRAASGSRDLRTQAQRHCLRRSVLRPVLR